jgi:hypothetical protein
LWIIRGSEIYIRVATKKTTEIKFYPKKSKSPVKAIRLFCLECMGWDRRYKDSGKPFEDVKNCPDVLCPLFDFRFGRNPFFKSKSKGNVEALEKYRASVNTPHELNENR